MAYQTSESVAGDYMMCALFAQYLVLATAPEDNRQFKVVASILITDLMVDAVDNGIGSCDLLGMVERLLTHRRSSLRWGATFLENNI